MSVQTDTSSSHAAAKLNVQLQVALTKLPVENSAIQLIMASLDLPVQSISAMQHESNGVAETCVLTKKK